MYNQTNLLIPKWDGLTFRTKPHPTFIPDQVFFPCWNNVDFSSVYPCVPISFLDKMTALVDHVFQNYPFSILFSRTCHLGRKMIRQNTYRRLGGKDFRWFFFIYLFFTYFYILERSTFLSFSFNVCVTLCPRTNTGVNFGQLPRIMQHWANKGRPQQQGRAGLVTWIAEACHGIFQEKRLDLEIFFPPNNFARRFQYWKFFFAPEKVF